jgi:hypothetical protein
MPKLVDSLLRLRFRGERRKTEADSENDREPGQPHAHLAWRMAGGSLAERDDAHQRPGLDEHRGAGQHALPQRLTDRL